MSGDGSTLAIAATKHDLVNPDGGFFSNSGKIQVFRHLQNGHWEEFYDFEGSENEEMGNSLALSSDGTTLAYGSMSFSGDGTDDQQYIGRVAIYKDFLGNFSLKK